jgi:type II secretory pathway component PulF
MNGSDSTDFRLPSGQPLVSAHSLGVLSGRERALIRVLIFSHRRSLDPGPMVIALGQEFPGRYGERLRTVGHLLNDGVHVLDAIARSPRVLDPSHLAALRLADQAGTLPEMYDSMLATEVVDSDEIDRVTGMGSEFLRLMLMTLLAWTLLSFLSIFIIPTFEQMFNEFGLELPRTTLQLIAISKLIPVVALFVFMLICLYLVWNSSIAFHWLTSRFFPSQYGKPWRPSAVKLQSLLALIPRLGLPIEHGLATVINSPCGFATKRRLSKALTRIKEGAEPWNALATERLIHRREAMSLLQIESNSAEAWILDWFAERRLRNIAGRRETHEQIFAFFNTVVLGIIVAWTAVSVFMVMSELISSLS